jgi:hypothetical protein
VGSGITVQEDSSFLKTTINTRLPTQDRFVVSGLTPVVSSFEVAAGDTSITIPVRVLPTSVAGTFSNAAPAQNEGVTITAPAGFSFANVTGVVIGADTGAVVAHAADGTSVTFVPRPGLDTIAARNRATIIGASSALYPSVPLTLPTDDSITIAPIASLPGTDAPGTAPTFTAVPLGQALAIFDKGTFAGTDFLEGGPGAQFYHITIPDSADYSVSVNWDGPTDVDAFLCNTDACDGTVAKQIGSGTAQPEASILTLGPATYLLALPAFFTDTVNVPPTDMPPRVAITVTHQ